MSEEPVDPLRPFDRRSVMESRTERVLLGRLQTEDTAAVIARRLRTAIRLGVLAHGEKLPRESDLAQQLGVTPFALREALATLRDEGLVVTRPGGRGGSFVQSGVGTAPLAAERLMQLTATELRDMGDWRSTITTSAAFLAAQRGSAQSADRLAENADALAVADSPQAARRALGRFHVELAAAAQSMRLTRADLAAHEEFDWLVQVLLGNPRHRDDIAAGMRAVGDAIRAGDPDAAWVASRRLILHEVTELTRHRLRLLAERSRSAPHGARDERAVLSSEIRRIADRTVGMLVRISDAISEAGPPTPRLAGLKAAVARSVLPELVEAEELVHGVGFMAEHRLLPEAPYWVQWWQRDADGTFDTDYSHQLDPAQDSFYNYIGQDYITQPRAHREPHAMGPYVDYGGVDDYLVTVSVPIVRDGTFLGVMCADIRVAGLERTLSPWLAAEAGVCIVLNQDSRVLLSNSVTHNVGDVVTDDAGLDVTSVGRFGWTIARGPQDF